MKWNSSPTEVWVERFAWLPVQECYTDKNYFVVKGAYIWLEKYYTYEHLYTSPGRVDILSEEALIALTEYGPKFVIDNFFD